MTITQTITSISQLPAATAWSRWLAVTDTDGSISVWWSTNDDLDAGFPSEFADLRYREPSRADFLAHVGGGSGWGLAAYRLVELDGVIL